MSSKNSEEIISIAKPHTIKKFKLIEMYTKSWVQILLNTPKCEGVVFIDCMCNSGDYRDINGKQVFGTPVRCSKILKEAADKYTEKKIYLIFNDKSAAKISHLRSILENEVGRDTNNFHVALRTEDANSLLKNIAVQLCGFRNLHCLLIYDPYEAVIDWDALQPFINRWNDIIINHMVSDSVRAVKAVKSDDAITKYESTYKRSIEELINLNCDKDAYEEVIESIIRSLRDYKKEEYYIASFPFFNRTNSLLYSLILCSSNQKAFKLYKNCAWKVFEGKSSDKKSQGFDNQWTMSFSSDGKLEYSLPTDNKCYHIDDIAKYLQDQFRGQENVSLEEVYKLLDAHPVFPGESFKNEIKKSLKTVYNAVVKSSTISFSDKA